ncbi:MAG: hypothetical protein ACXQS2_00360 [Methermicoccaceae archaeon]
MPEKVRLASERVSIENMEDTNLMFFPLNKNWYWYPATARNETLKPGQSLKILDVKGAGWLHSAILWCNNPYATLKVELFSKRLLKFDLPIESVYQLGFYDMGRGQFTVTRYSDTHKIYVMQFVPIGFGTPFRDWIKVEIYNPFTVGENITVNFAEVLLIRLEERAWVMTK